jgi:hypothetical protein
MFPSRYVVGVSDQQYTLTAFYPSTHWKGDRVGPRAGLDGMDNCKLRDPRNSNLSVIKSARQSQSLYQLLFRACGSVTIQLLLLGNM